MRGSNFWKISALLIVLSTPVSAESEFEMFEEICAITGEVRQTLVYHNQELSLSVVEPLEIEVELNN